MRPGGRKSPGAFLEKSEPVFAEKLLPGKLKAEGGQRDELGQWDEPGQRDEPGLRDEPSLVLSWRWDAAGTANRGSSCENPLSCCQLLQQLRNLQKVDMEIRKQKCLCISVSMQETKLEGDSCFSPSPIAEVEISCDYILSEKTGNICHIICLAAAVSGPLGWKHSPFLTQQMQFTASIAGDCQGRLRCHAWQRSARVTALDNVVP